jgi:hypothetical protein
VAYLDTPTASGDPDEFGDGHGVAGVADVVGQLGGFADRATDQQRVLVGSGVDQ